MLVLVNKRRDHHIKHMSAMKTATKTVSEPGYNNAELPFLLAEESLELALV